jgi:DNA-binding LacI/PurR family transcriptional regulator
MLKQYETTIDIDCAPSIIARMSTDDTGPSKAHWLANRMEEDIRGRGLRPGEPFWTTAQAGRQMGISKSMAYRAMKILTNRQLLVSHPGRGTFVGPKVADAAFGQTKCCHVFLTHDLFKSSGQSAHGWLAGLSATFVGYGIQFDFISLRDAVGQAQRFIEQGLASGTLACVVLVGCPREVQELVLLRGVPALVLGSDYSSTRRLPSVDADQLEAGRLATQYLLRRGCRRIALLMRETWFPGDRRMFEGIGQGLDEAKLGHEALVLRNLSVDPAALAGDMQRLLAQDGFPRGCICRSPLFARAAIDAAQSLGLKVPGDLHLVIAGLDRQAAADLSVPRVSMKVNTEELAALGGRMLLELLEGRQPDPLHAILPVELVEPDHSDQRPPKPSHQCGRVGRAKRSPTS